MLGFFDYASLSLTFWKLLIFQWGLIKSGLLEFSSPLQYVILNQSYLKDL